MMLKRIPTVALALALSVLSAFAISAQTGGRGVLSPEVTPDRRVIFRFVAPAAKQVSVAGELDGKPHPLVKGADGVWSATVGPLDPDIYTYAFNGDGVTALDPQNPNTKWPRPGGSRSSIPGRVKDPAVLNEQFKLF